MKKGREKKEEEMERVEMYNVFLRGWVVILVLIQE